MFKYIIATLFSLSASVYAGQERGGTTSVVCFNAPVKHSEMNCIYDSVKRPICQIPNGLINSIVSVESLDLYEARMARSLEGDVKPVLIHNLKNESIDSYITRVTRRMDKYILDLGTVVSMGQSFVKNLRVVSAEQGIPPIIDLGVAALPNEEKCVFSTMIVQEGFGSETRVLVDQRLMKHPTHSALSERVSWLHEYIYSYLRTLKKHTTTLPTRTAVKYMITHSPMYTVDDVLTDLLDIGVLPAMHPTIADTSTKDSYTKISDFYVDGRQIYQVSTADYQISQALEQFFDTFESYYTATFTFKNYSEMVEASLLSSEFTDAMNEIPDLTPKILSGVRNRLRNVMTTEFRNSMMTPKDTVRWELSAKARMAIRRAYFVNFSHRNDILIR